MSRTGEKVLSMLLWVWGGAVYFLLEVAYKTITGHPERISWTMLILATLLCIPVEQVGAELSWNLSLLIQALICALLVTITEFFAGCILNLYLGLDIWDYSNLPLNLLGQICVPFLIVWFFLCIIFIPIFDFMRYSISGGTKPHYYLW